MGTKAEDILKDHEKLKAERRVWERDWQDIRELVRPFGSDFQRTTIPGESRTLNLYDGTAMAANVQLASGLHSFLCNPVDRWFSLGLSNERIEADDESLEWLELVSDTIYAVYSNEDTCFNQSIGEGFLDLGSFGTGCISQEWSDEIQNPFFKSHAAASCWYKENHRSQIDTVHKESDWTYRQIVQRFGAGCLTQNMASLYEKDPDRQERVVHIVSPRSDRQEGKLDARNKRYQSIYLCAKEKHILFEGGYDSLPYHASRWAKLAEEVYGRSPAALCLPDIRMLNQMERIMIKAANKLVDPPIIVENDGVLLPLKTHAGAIIFKEPGAEAPTPLITGISLPINMEMSDQKRKYIEECFHADWIRMEKENIEMTATEVMDRREEKLRLIAPILGRQQSELLGPLIMRTFSLLVEKKRIPPAPALIQQNQLKITYVSPAAKAQTGVKAVAMTRFVQEMLPLEQVRPGTLDAIDFDMLARELSIARQVPRSIMRKQSDIKKMRASQQATQQAQQAAAVAEPASQAVKNIADARAKGTDVSPILSQLMQQ